jgi:hypothetical protein
MSAVSCNSAVQYQAGLSILKSANRQPELALEMLVKSLEGSSVGVQSPAVQVPPSVAPEGTGLILDIVA